MVDKGDVAADSIEEMVLLEPIGLKGEKGGMKKLKKEKHVYDNDIRNAELVIDGNSADPFEVMRIQTYDDCPMAKEPDDIVIKVEAATVSEVDCRIRDGTYPWKFGAKPEFPIVPGVDCVGTVSSVGELAIKSGLDVGDRVAALSLDGCTAKYITLKIEDVIKVPDAVDPTEAVAVIRTYTAAFQALMTNVSGYDRYSRKPLSGDRILVVGPCGVFERAVIELAVHLGSKRVYFSCVSSGNQSHEMYIRTLGARPLSGDPEDWADELEGKIDVAIDSSCVDRYEHTYGSLDETGILVSTGMEELSKQSDILSKIEKAWVSAYISMNPRCYFFEGIIESFQANKKKFMKDLIFLFNVLEKGKIKPKVATRISMKKVAAAQERLDISPESLERRGVIVVEPWLLPPDDEN